jgi:diguanylate cyclase (GGDEF)-like protein/putative nucleotidyltransferase with HDIG domain
MRPTFIRKPFLHGVLIAGAIAFAWSVVHLSTPDPLKFICYCALSLIAATLRVEIPELNGALAVNYIFVLIGLTDLSLPECMVATVLATVLQCLVRLRKPASVEQVLFNVSNVAVAVVACGSVLDSPWLISHGAGLLLRLTLATVTYFIVNTFAVTAMITLTESKPLFRVWRECYLWVFPFFFLGAGFARGFHWLAARFGWQMAMLSLPAIYILWTAFRFYLERLRNEKKRAQDLAALHLRTIEALALAIDAKDQATDGHLRRVQVYVTEIARELNVSRPEMEALQAAAMLHDIGKLAVPEHIISKPGKLTTEEFEKMKIHPVVGAEILERVEFPYPVADIVRCHHEKWDGTGYPAGLRGEAIPIGARILSVVDCLDALATDRDYRKAATLDQAMNMIAEQSGTAFDPGVVTILRRRYRELEAMARAKSADPVLKPVQSRGNDSMAGDNGKPGFLTSIGAARQEVQTLLELSDDLVQSLRHTNTLLLFADKLKLIVPHDLLCIYAIGAIGQDVLVPEYVNGTEQFLYSSLRIPIGQGLSGWAAENNTPVVNGNPAAEPGYLNDPTVITNLKSALVIPLEENGRPIGVLSLYARERNAFSRDHLRVLQALAPRLEAVLSNGRRMSEAQDHAVTDYLTGLPNSRSLYLHLDAEMSRCRRRHATLGVFLCDLDGFKTINDEHGHLEGNCVLKAVAADLKDCCRGYDYVTRMGGDEFVVLAPDMQEVSLEENVQRFRDTVKGTGARLGYPGLSCSIGAVIFNDNPGDGDPATADAILAEADRRMYADKKRNRTLRPGDENSAEEILLSA